MLSRTYCLREALRVPSPQQHATDGGRLGLRPLKGHFFALLAGMTSCTPIDDVSLWPGMSYEDVDRVSAGTGSRLKELIRSYATPIRGVGRFTLVNPRTFAPMLSLKDVKLDPIEFGRAIVHFTVAALEGGRLRGRRLAGSQRRHAGSRVGLAVQGVGGSNAPVPAHAPLARERR